MASIQLVKPHAGGQRAIYRHPARFHVVACGRRFGKTVFGKLALYETIFKHGLDAWWVGPTYKMSSGMWRELRSELKPYAQSISGQDRMIELRNGATLTVWTGSQYDTMRGGAPGIVVIDEAAMIPNGTEMWNAAIQPALTDHMGRALFLSTPRGRNWFWDLFRMGQDDAITDYKAWQFPSWYNPKWTKQYFEGLKISYPEQYWMQEYAAVFLEDAGAVFRGVMAVATGEYREPYQGNFVIGVDWGKSNDFTVIAVWDADKRQMVDMDRFNKIGWAHQLGRLRVMIDKWQARRVIVEQNSIGDVLLEQLMADGLPVEGFQTTGTTKPQLIQNFALAIEKGELTLLNDRVLVNELQAYEMKTTRYGHTQYNAPDGSHDDTVIASAIGFQAINHGVGKSAPTYTRISARRGRR